MTRIFFTLVLLAAANSAFAQNPSTLRRTGFAPPSRPVTSPYLNLLRGNGRSTAFNYFQRVRPEQEFRNNANRFRQSLNQLNQRVAAQQQQINAGGGLSTTGHSATFQNYGGYFPGLPGGNLGAGRQPALQPQTRQPPRR